MFSPKFAWTIISFFAILLIGIGFREWLVLVSLIPLTLMILANYITRPPEKLNLEVRRELEQTRFQEGEHVEISLRIKNKGSESIDMLEILDALPTQVSLRKGSNHLITSLDAGEETTVRYIIRCDHRGRWMLGPTHFRARNFLSSAFVVKSYIETETEFIIIPRFEAIKDIPFRTRYPKISDGPFHSTLKGEGLDFTGVREYSPSDTLRRINWKVVAKYGRLFSNEFELYRASDLLLILDATEGTASVIDDQIKAVLSLTEYFIKYKCRVGLIIIRDTVDSFKLSSSRQQLLRFTEKLIDVEATKVEKYGMVNKRLKLNLDLYFPLNCLTIFISPLVNPVMNESFIAAARSRRNSFFLAPSIISAEWRYVKNKDDPSIVITHQNLLIRRKTEIVKVVQEGEIVLEWDVTIPFSVFMTKLKRVALRRGRK